MPDSAGRYAYFPSHRSFRRSHFGDRAAMKLARSLTVVLLLVAMGATFWVFRTPPVWQPPALPAGYQKAKADALFASAFKQFDARASGFERYRGRPLIVYFWAAWCVECRTDIKTLMTLQQRHAAEGLAVIAIGIDQSDTLQRIAREQGIDYPMFVAGDDGIALSRRMGNLLGELPYAAAINRHGVFAAQQLGFGAAGALESLAAAALK